MDSVMQSLENAYLREWEGGCSYEEEEEDNEYRNFSISEDYA